MATKFTSPVIWDKLLKVFIKFYTFAAMPFSLIVEWIYKIRRFAFEYGLLKVQRFQVPIISVGNLAMGGTGKTPFTLWLSHYLNSIDKKVLILSRGHKGAFERSRSILKSGVKLGLNPYDHGDEPFMLAKGLKYGAVVVGRNRVENLKYSFKRESPDVVLMDDGHQHLKLGRKMNIVLFDALMPLAKYKVFPSGYMREGFSALKSAHIIIIGRSDQAGPQRIQSLKKILSPYKRHHAIFAEMVYRPLGLFDKNYRLVLKPEELKDRRVLCVSGIAMPFSFFSLMESLGAEVISKISFPDHHYYTDKEVRAIVKKAQEKNAQVVVTEKDMVKIKGLLEQREVLHLRIEVSFISGEEKIKKRIRDIL